MEGCFFQEQAQFLHAKKGFDFVILYGSKKSYPLHLWFWIWLNSWIISFWSISKDKVKQGPPAFGFDFPANRRVPDSLQIGLEKRIFYKAYKCLIRKGWKPDLIHAQSGMDAGIYAHEISKIEKIPFVLIEHQVVIFHHYSRLRARLVLNAFKSAEKLGAVSSAQKRQMVMHEPECFPIVIPNLVDEFQFPLRENSLEGTFRILTVIYPNAIKGYNTFFETLRILNEWEVDFQFIIVGNGVSLFKEILREMKIDSCGKIIETVKRKDMPKIMANAHLYVCSSDFETFGIAVREAMMCGLPVISTANGGVEGSITSETGMIVPIRDAQALAEAILKLKNNYSSYKAEAIRKFIIKQCGRKVFESNMIEFYTNG